MRDHFKVLAGIVAAAVLLGGGRSAAEEIGVVPAADVSAARPGGGEEYRIGAADVLSVSVWQHTDMDQTLTVRHDGKVTYNLLGDITAGGRTPAELDAEITERLREFIRNPQVTIRIVESNSRKVLILGAVNRAGPYLLQGSPRLLEVLSEVGWNDATADLTSITVLRASGEILRVNLQALLYNGDMAQNVVLRPDDTVFVPPKGPAAGVSSGGVAGASPIAAQTVRILALGELTTAGPHEFPAGSPLSVKTLLLAAGGVTDRAALGRAKIVRADNSQEPVDLNRLLFDGDMSQDLPLGSGDVFYVPQTRNMRVFVLGMVSSPGIVEAAQYADGTRQEALSVLQAIVLAGHERNGAVLSNVKIVRDYPNDPKVITVNLERLLRQGDVAQNVPLREGDVVFVPQSFGDIALETYRKLLSPISPTATAIGTLRSVSRGSATSISGSGI